MKYLPTLMIVRNMARRALLKSKIDSPEKVASVDRISSGDQEIIINSVNKSTHHGPEISSFSSLKLRNDVIEGLENLKISQPTVIQMLAIPQVLSKKNIFCAAQTGSGKTIVYAASIIHSLKNEVNDGFIERFSRPRALVVAPSRELAQQILQVFKSFSSSAPIRSCGLIGQQQKKWTREYMKGLVDVVVGTPNTILKYQMKGLLNLTDIRYLVLDEADTLMDDNFTQVTNQLLGLCHFSEVFPAKPPVQCILAAATLPPKGVLNGYKEYIPDLEVVQSNLHRVLPHVKHTFIKTTQEQKIEHIVLRLRQLLRKDGRKSIIFCNTSKSCNWLSIMLHKNEIQHSKLHGNMNPQIRFKDFNNFMNGDMRILVCTDIASRGLDTTDVSLVINLDCPFTTTDYIHRSGRTGRATQLFHGESEVVTYITQNKEVIFARKIEAASLKNEGLDDIKKKKKTMKQQYDQDMEEYKKLQKLHETKQ